MKAAKWREYSVIATGDGYKLERWGKVVLLRPDPQVIWPASRDMERYPDLAAKYVRRGGGGSWERLKKFPEEWTVSYRNLTFKVKPMGFKHTGLFPEQAVNWDVMDGLIKNAGRKISVLNLFAYTGGATVACAAAGASVCHVDAAKNMVERAGENLRLSGLETPACALSWTIAKNSCSGRSAAAGSTTPSSWTRRVTAGGRTAKCGNSKANCSPS